MTEPASSLDAAVTTLPGIGPGSAEKLARLDIVTIRDLILHVPFRYQDRTRSVPFGELVPGRECVVTGEVASVNVAYRGRSRSLLVTLSDGERRVTVRFFHFNVRQRRAFQAGLWMRCFGDVRPGLLGLEMVHPEYRLHREEPASVEAELTPVYQIGRAHV